MWKTRVRLLGGSHVAAGLYLPASAKPDSPRSRDARKYTDSFIAEFVHNHPEYILSCLLARPPPHSRNESGLPLFSLVTL